MQKLKKNAQKLSKSYVLCAHGTVDDEVDGAVDDEGEVLDGGEGEHPAGVLGQQTCLPTHVGPPRHARLE